MQSMEKWVTRSDAWTSADDEKLADLVLYHIRTGSTQLKAFEEASRELGRTSAACGYRWNGVLRKDLRPEIEQAKLERKQAGRSTATPTQSTGGSDAAQTVTSGDTMKEVIQFLKTYDEQYQSLRAEVERLSSERETLQERVRELEEAQASLAPNASSLTPEQLERDSRTLVAIMERARRLLDPTQSSAD